MISLDFLCAVDLLLLSHRRLVGVNLPLRKITQTYKCGKEISYKSPWLVSEQCRLSTFLYVVCHTMTNPQNQLYFSSTSGNMFPPFINCQNVLLMGVPVVNEHAVLSFQPPFILKHLSVKKMLKADLKTAWEV